MRAMFHPDYEYKPLSPRHRRKLSKLQRARFAPEGMRCVYGVFIPERWAEVVRKAAEIYRLKHTLEDTTQFTELLFGFLRYHDASGTTRLDHQGNDAS